MRWFISARTSYSARGVRAPSWSGLILRMISTRDAAARAINCASDMSPKYVSQRLFAEYVGIGPKWVIRRCRLHEVTERLATSAEIDWASLAVEIGYADQAHFVRDFKEMFGESPTWYAERYKACPVDLRESGS